MSRPRLTPERKCIEDISTDNGFRQCGNWKGHGPNGQYCVEHGRKQDEHAGEFEAIETEGTAA